MVVFTRIRTGSRFFLPQRRLYTVTPAVLRRCGRVIHFLPAKPVRRCCRRRSPVKSRCGYIIVDIEDSTAAAAD